MVLDESAGFMAPRLMSSRRVDEAQPLLPFLIAGWPDVKRSRIKQWLKFGSVRVNDEPITQHNHPLRSGDVVRIQIKGARRPSATQLPGGLEIVYEDDRVVVLDKAAGWLTIAKDSGRGRTAYAAVTAHVRRSDPEARIWLVHRIDRETSGLLLFARTEPDKRWLQDNWRRFDKTYLAVVEGNFPEDEGTLRSHLDESNTLRVKSTAPGPKTREAITHFRVVKRGRDLTLVELRLETGRRHQIRVQLADLGHPIIGDERYGAETDPAGRLGLHAAEIRFEHPQSGTSMTFTSSLPGRLTRLFKRSAGSHKSRR